MITTSDPSAAIDLNEVAERLRLIVRQSGGNQRVSELSGVPLRTLNGYLSGETEPKLSTLAKVLRSCGVSISEFLAGDWLQSDATNGIVDSRSISATTGIPAGFVAVPRLQVRASAGRGRIATIDLLEDGEFIAFREDWMRRIGLNPKFAQALTAVGDSMEPTIRDGDLLLIDRSIDRVVDNGIYVAVVGGMVVVKRVQTRLDGSVVLKSDNRDRYDDEVVPAHDVPDLIIEGRVRWFGRAI
ncbi:XRE family transcriptional regulator [Kaistia sp. MMO-174]|uniref:XRE family transcriptional regulator n=1 Tax=Kaistia sp. MMO-174 TaxID=3081256 RepID=UPI00301802D4